MFTAFFASAQDEHKLKFISFFEYVPSGYTEPHYLCSDANYMYFYHLKRSHKDIRVLVYDINTNEQKINSKIKLPKKYQDSEIYELKILNGALYIFTSFFNRKDEKTYFFCESFNLNRAESNGDLKMLF